MNEICQIVWVVAELIDQHGDENDQNLEDLEPAYFESLVRGLENAGYQWAHVPSPQDLCRRAEHGEFGVVFPLWAGRTSRNRRALVPSACEIWGLPYVGADPYAALVCQDKALAKGLASDAGFRVARHHLLPLHRDVKTDSSLLPPFVVKPSLEGGSMGIDNANVVSTHKEADELAKHLRDKWQQPTLVEEFAPGREVSLCISGPREDPIFGGVEVEVTGYPHFFDQNVFGASVKKGHKFPRRNITVSSDEVSPFFEPSVDLLKRLGKIDFLRIDGKLVDGRFTVIELTPDAHLGVNAGFAVALCDAAGGYPNLLHRLVTIARPS